MKDPQILPRAFAGRPRIIFTDIDDTLTLNGKLPVETFSALQQLKDAGIPVVPVTGACSAWCDCIVRTWPVDTIIGENGAIIIENKDRHQLQYIAESDLRDEYKKRLLRLIPRVLSEVPRARLSHDSLYRLTDIAFDIGQDQQLSAEEAAEIVAICKGEGATTRMSSIHINVWFGDYNKASTAKEYLRRLALTNEDALFTGDSPNDEDMFAIIENSVGVANISPFLDTLVHLPRYITAKPGGLGFAEVAEAVLRSS